MSISAHNLDEALPLLARRDIGFRALLDRASEADPAYLPIVEIARASNARRFNARERADRSYDKATIHHAFVEDGIPTPQTVILPPFHLQPEMPCLDLTAIAGPFTVKPALGGGGEGVVLEISTREEIQSARQQFPEQEYLLQEHVTPKVLLGLPAWFRVIYCLGDFHISFWDTTTHVYTPVDEASGSGGHAGPPQQPGPSARPDPHQSTVGAVLRDSPNLRESPIPASLREVTQRIARLCQLDLFSTEIALTEDDRLLVVDYVNDPIDLRLQSRAVDGVPDLIVEQIATQIVGNI